MSFNKAARAMLAASRKHSYSMVEIPPLACGRRLALAVHEPDTADGARVCVLDGDPQHPMTARQAEAICAALDRLMKKENA